METTPTPTTSDADDSPQRETAAGFAKAQVVIKPRRAAPFYGRHPWVYESAIARIDGDCTDGDIVDVVTEKSKFIARGIIHRGSRLRVRLYGWDAQQPLNPEFWRERIDTAVRWRERMGYDDPQGGARLIYSEADGISGLIVDRYGPHLVMQVNSLAMYQRLDCLTQLLIDRLAPQSIFLQSESAVARVEGITLQAGLLCGELPYGPIFIEEHGIRYGLELARSQKTGFYLDQRENRRVTASYLADRRVLDMFCYSGGFSLSAVKLGGAAQVLGIDSSERAIVCARANAELNEISNVRFQQADCFETLDALATGSERYGAVILDPPKFTRTRQSVNDALRAYHRINRRAVELLERDGILVTCSCSGNISNEDFLNMLSGVAQKTGRDIQILEQRGAAPDHPVSSTCAESAYLKCFICRVV